MQNSEETITFFINIDRKVALLIKILFVFQKNTKKCERERERETKNITFFININMKRGAAIENPCLQMQNTQKHVKKNTLRFILLKIAKRRHFYWTTLCENACLTRGTLAEPFFEPAPQSRPTCLYMIFSIRTSISGFEIERRVPAGWKKCGRLVAFILPHCVSKLLHGAEFWPPNQFSVTFFLTGSFFLFLRSRWRILVCSISKSGSTQKFIPRELI